MQYAIRMSVAIACLEFKYCGLNFVEPIFGGSFSFFIGEWVKHLVELVALSKDHFLNSKFVVYLNSGMKGSP